MVCLERESDKVISVSSDHAPLLLTGDFKLLKIGQAFCPNLMDTHRINPSTSQLLGNLLAQIFVQIKLHFGLAMTAGYSWANFSSFHC